MTINITIQLKGTQKNKTNCDGTEQNDFQHICTQHHKTVHNDALLNDTQ